MSTKQAKKILWVLPKYTFPVNDGARVASNSLLTSLLKNRVTVDLAVFADTADCNMQQFKQQWPIRNCFFIQRPFFTQTGEKFLFWLKNLLYHPFTALTLGPFNYAQRQVIALLQQENYDYIVFDGLHPWQSFCSLDLRASKVIYRAHNVESDLWKTAAQKKKNPLLKLFLRWQEQLMAQREKDLINRCFQLWAISEEDQQRFNQLYAPRSCQVVPVGMNFSLFKRRQYQWPIKLFFLGRLDWPPNREGLRWFLEKVWPTIEKTQKYQLHIAGSGDGRWIENYLGTRITFHGRVDDLVATYQQMHLAIMPIFFGSGTRIKVIESVEQGIPLLSTSMGVQGSGLAEDCFLLANNEQEWIAQLEQLKIEQLEQMAWRAWKQLRSTLDYTVIAQQLEKLLVLE